MMMMWSRNVSTDDCFGWQQRCDFPRYCVSQPHNTGFCHLKAEGEVVPVDGHIRDAIALVYRAEISLRQPEATLAIRDRDLRADVAIVGERRLHR